MNMFQFPGAFLDGMRRGGRFVHSYSCFSLAMYEMDDKTGLEKGGKILMPSSALEELTGLNIQYPMLFKLTNTETNAVTHCGVQEFVADEGNIYVPYWMMKNLLIHEGGSIKLENVSLSSGTFVRFQPQSTDFLEISNPKAVLENGLRNYACLTEGDIVAISYNNRIYELLVMEVKPQKAVSIIETDMVTDFAPPVGYVEPERAVEKTETEQRLEEAVKKMDTDTFRPFRGAGNRISGKIVTGNNMEELPADLLARVGIPDYGFNPRRIVFIRANPTAAASKASPPDEPEFKPFAGSGHTIREARRK